MARRDDYNGEREEGARMVAWAVAELPDGPGYWPSQAVATHALCGVPAIDSAAATIFGSLVPDGRWDRRGAGRHRHRRGPGRPDRCRSGGPPGRSRGTPTAVGGGSIDAFCEQIVAGADEPGDVLVIFGATLIVWVVSDEWLELPGIHDLPLDRAGPGVDRRSEQCRGTVRRLGAGHGRCARSPAGRPAVPGAAQPDAVGPGDPGAVPVWLPYLRGERTPFHDPWLRASLHGLDITMGPGSVVRAAHEASGFVVRRMIERSGVTARRIVATGGGSRSAPWMAAVADATGLPVDTVAVPEGAALGAAFLARMAAGLESDFGVAATWATRGRTIEPDPALGGRRLRPLPPRRGTRPAGVSGWPGPGPGQGLRPVPARRLAGWG